MLKAVKNSNSNGSGTVIITTPHNIATYTNHGVTVTPNYSNVSITGGGAGLTYSTATTAGPNWVADSYYHKQPRVKITDEDIEIDGLSLKETMLAIKNELQIPTRLNRDAALEREFTELKAAAEQYQELERKFLEQKKMWETLKKQDS